MSKEFEASRRELEHELRDEVWKAFRKRLERLHFSTDEEFKKAEHRIFRMAFEIEDPTYLLKLEFFSPVTKKEIAHLLKDLKGIRKRARRDALIRKMRDTSDVVYLHFLWTHDRQLERSKKLTQAYMRRYRALINRGGCMPSLTGFAAKCFSSSDEQTNQGPEVLEEGGPSSTNMWEDFLASLSCGTFYM